MPTDKQFLNYVLDQLEPPGEMTTKSMFGEYMLYSDRKLYAMLADNRILLKPTAAGRAFLKDPSKLCPIRG